MRISKWQNKSFAASRVLKPPVSPTTATSPTPSRAIAMQITRWTATESRFPGLFLLAGTPISWQAKKQTTVAQSTVESEYAAMAHAAKELIWLRQLLKDLGMSKYRAPTTLYSDNQGAISLAKNPTHHAKTKHVDVQLHFIRDHVEKGR
jgi:hypothetical protein